MPSPRSGRAFPNLQEFSRITKNLLKCGMVPTIILVTNIQNLDLVDAGITAIQLNEVVRTNNLLFGLRPVGFKFF